MRTIRTAASLALLLLACRAGRTEAEPPAAKSTLAPATKAEEEKVDPIVAALDEFLAGTTDPCLIRCREGELAACVEGLGRMREAKVDDDVRVALADRTCERGEPRICFGIGFSRDPADPFTLRALERGCEVGSGDACLWRVILADEGKAPKLSPEAERALLERACENEQGKGCERLAASLAAEPPERRDEARILAVRVRGCDNNGVDACHALLADGSLEEKRRRVYERLCGEGAAWACTGLAGLEVRDAHGQSGEQAAATRQRAYQRLADACQTGYRWGCVQHAVETARGTSSPRDVDAAVAALNKLCATGYDPACTQLMLWNRPEPKYCQDL